MSEQSDARLEELRLLAKVERMRELRVHVPPNAPPSECRQREVLAFLLHAGYLNDISVFRWTYVAQQFTGFGGRDEPSVLATRFERDRLDELNRLLGGQEATLRIGHPGRLRMAELCDAMQRHRIKDAFGILWDQRHVTRDLGIALTRARVDSPITVAVFDLNDFKQVNDRHGHEAGNAVLQEYLSGLAKLVGEQVECYRSGGDEAVLIAAGVSPEVIAGDIDQALQAVSATTVTYNSVELRLSIACGISSSIDPEEDESSLLVRADTEMYRAKKQAKESSPVPSAIGVAGRDVTIVG